MEGGYIHQHQVSRHRFYSSHITIIITIIIGGSTWTMTEAPSTATTYWYGIASDEYGIYLAAVRYNVGIYISTSG